MGDAGVTYGDGWAWTPDPLRGSVRGQVRGPLGAQVLPGRQETGGAGIMQCEITETEMHWMSFAKMN